MSLYKRKGSDLWWVGFTVNGRRIQKSTGTADRAQAQAIHDRMKAAQWDHRPGAKPDPLWEAAAAAWLAEKAGVKKTLADDIARLREIDRHLAGRKLSAITADVILDLRQRLLKKPHGRVKGTDWKAAPKTINNYLGTVQAILNYAYAREWLERVPHIPMYRAPKRLRWLRPEEAQALQQALPPYMAEMMRLTLATGLRRGNVMRLRWSQVDLTRRVAWFEAGEMKGGEPHLVPLNDDAVAVLRRQQGRHPLFVFVNGKGRPLKTFPYRNWQRAVARAGLADLRWHDLRHTWASWHVQAGTNPLELRELGGWKKLDMVMRYAHLSRDRLAAAAQRIVTVPLHAVREK